MTNESDAIWRSFQDSMLSPEHLGIPSMCHSKEAEDARSSKVIRDAQSSPCVMQGRIMSLEELLDEADDSRNKDDDDDDDDGICFFDSAKMMKSPLTAELQSATTESSSTGHVQIHHCQVTKQSLKCDGSQNTTVCSPVTVAPPPSADACHRNSYSQKHVHFAEGSVMCVVHEIRAWSYAYKAARKGLWEQCARDRVHFQRKITNIASIVEPCLVKKIAAMDSDDEKKPLVAYYSSQHTGHTV